MSFKALSACPTALKSTKDVRKKIPAQFQPDPPQPTPPEYNSNRPPTNQPFTFHPPSLYPKSLPAVWPEHVPLDSLCRAAMSPEPCAEPSSRRRALQPSPVEGGAAPSASVLPTAACLCLGTAQSSREGQAEPVKGKLMKFMGWISFTREFMKRCLESKEQMDSISFRSGSFLGSPGKNHPSASVML